MVPIRTSVPFTWWYCDLEGSPTPAHNVVRAPRYTPRACFSDHVVAGQVGRAAR